MVRGRGERRGERGRREGSPGKRYASICRGISTIHYRWDFTLNKELSNIFLFQTPAELQLGKSSCKLILYSPCFFWVGLFQSLRNYSLELDSID